MGWWGPHLFAGDQPLDWLGEIQQHIENQIEKIIKEDENTAPATIFFYADFLKKYPRRTGKLYKYTKWLRTYVKKIKEKDNWKSKDQRIKTIQLLIDEIETTFKKKGQGYGLDPDKFPKINIIGKRVYHLTKKETLSKGILQEGLKPQECYAGFMKNKTGIYVSSSILGALKWQFHVLGHSSTEEPAIISFVVNEKDEVYQDMRVDFKDDYVVCNEIPTHRLTIFA